MRRHNFLNLLIGLIALAGIILSVSCSDDFDGFRTDIGEGSANINAELNFTPFVSTGLDTRAEGNPGNSLANIRDLAVLIYKEDGSLYKTYGFSRRQINPVSVTRDTIHGSSERFTEQAKAALGQLPYGRYYAVAVANLSKIGEGNPSTLDILENQHSEEIGNIETLRDIRISWDMDQILNNGQMFGYFDTNSAYELQDTAPLLVIDKPGVTLHAWLQRSASKLTVDIDASQLNENIYVYIKHATIKDIASSCSLGSANTVDPSGEPRVGMIADSKQYILMSDGDDAYRWDYVSRGRPFLPRNADNGSAYDVAHSETAESLFFYENLQGEGRDKSMQRNPDGSIDYVEKDGMPYGTYVEVEGHYHSNANQSEGNGSIKYRFMLGRNVTTDYNVFRNCHYKLTLKIKGNGNDADWHIKYDKDTDPIHAPNPYYISYLYNHSTHMPITCDNIEGYELEKLTAEIIENNWGPYEPDAGMDLYWDAYKHSQANPELYVHNGFLSLRRCDDISIDPADGTKSEKCNKDHWNNNSLGYAEYQVKGKEGYNHVPEKGQSVNLNVSTEAKSKHFTDYNVIRQAKSVKVEIPMSTRAKQLNKLTGYTGNNPYRAYKRAAKVKVTATYKATSSSQTKVYTKDLNVFQVQRVVNPAGIYRSWDNPKNFHVRLMCQPTESSAVYEPIESEGPWVARVRYGDTDFFTLDGKSEVSGHTGSFIDFNVQFKGKLASKSQVKSAVIEVRYHNYSCVHLIMVRQGYEPVKLCGDATIDFTFESQHVTKFIKSRRWATFNVKTSVSLTDSPVEEGSMFRFGNLIDAIDATNLDNDQRPWLNVNPSMFKYRGNQNFLIAGTNTTKKINEINTNSSGFNTTINHGGITYKAPSLDDYLLIRAHSGVEELYGVCYADNATTTSNEYEIACNYRRDRSEDAVFKAKMDRLGMRGVFVYNIEDDKTFQGKHIFLPIGHSGYGRLKYNEGKVANAHNAVLRYAGSIDPIKDGMSSEGVYTRPLLYPLYRNEGAIYWLDKSDYLFGKSETGAWDINYINLDFNPFFTSNIWSWVAPKTYEWDACFLRMVVDE